MIVIGKWDGLVTNVSPYNTPPTAAATQVNLQCLVPGQIQSRPGMANVTTIGYTGATTAVQRAVNFQNGSVPMVVYQNLAGTLIAATTTLGAVTGVTVTGQTYPLSMFKGRFNDLYGVNGYGRGFRWDGANTQVEPLGLKKPTTLTAPTGATTASDFVSAVQIIDGGAGYQSAPTVTFSGGGATTQAAGFASIQNGRVSGVTITNRGAGYTGTPTIAFSGGQGTSAAFTVNVQGEVVGFQIPNSGAGYTGAPVVNWATTNGLTNQNVLATVDTTLGKLIGFNILAAGTGATTTGQAVTLSGGGATTQGTMVPVMSYSVVSVSVAHSGSGYYAPPVVTIVPDASDQFGGGAIVRAAINSSGNITGATVYNGGRYALPPTATITNSQATAVATVSKKIFGTYKCAIRYIDDTPTTQGGPIPSSISDLVEVDATAGLSTLTWTLDHTGADLRANAVELWRTTADQTVALYRVAVLPRSAGVLPTSFTDPLTDKELLDPARDSTIDGYESKYGFMPIVLPSGQVNARRFEPPPENMAIGLMFQDRAWYMVDTSGAKPNSLLYSEIDEPESVHPDNELIIQENANDSDAIVTGIPFGSSLLVVQSRHIYRLNYVAQPIFDATIQLVSYRGIINSQCWDVFSGVAFIADDYGLYAFDGSNEQDLSAPIGNYWRDGIIDFSKRSVFHVKVDPQTRIVRFFYCKSGDGAYPTRALCFSIATKAWWEEEYAQAISAAVTTRVSGKQGAVFGTVSGTFLAPSGLVDSTTAGGTTSVSYRYRTPPMPLNSDNANRASPPGQTPSKIDPVSRCVSILYTPTAVSCPISIGLHYNNSTTARTNAIASDRGGGFVTTLGTTAATLDMAATRSSLGDSNGKATAYISGRHTDRSVGADRHVAIAFSGTQAETVRLHGLTIEGAG